MLIVLTSPDVIAPDGTPQPELVQAFRKIRATNPAATVSNHPAPPWHSTQFPPAVDIPHIREVGRQGGDIITRIAAGVGLHPYDTMVVAGKMDDVQMGKNGGAVIVAAGWSTDQKVRDLGIQVASVDELQEVVKLTTGWTGDWWFRGKETAYNVFALADLSGYNVTVSQEDFARRVTRIVKNGGPRLVALLTVTARSLLINGYGTLGDTMWGVYPSSSSDNTDADVLSDFTHRLRTTVSRVRYAKRGEPLFIRHRPSTKRSGGGGNRTDPSEQIETLHINPTYRRNIKGRHVIVVDDCTTYGVSFGVAAALLRRAGASAVSGVALGKFGSRLDFYDIVVKSDPFAPVGPQGYDARASRRFMGTTNPTAQQVLITLIQ